MKSLSISEFLEADGSGDLFLRDRVFSGVEFVDFSICPASGQSINLLSLRFDNCWVSTGTCVIREGSILRSVFFSDFQCGDAMHVSSSALLDRVKVSGVSKPHMIWIKPSLGGASGAHLYDEVEWALDISEYDGQVSVTGIPVEKVLIHPDRHVIARADWLDTIEWESLGIGGLSYWKILAKKVASAGEDQGVFSFPRKSNKRYEKSMSEYRILKDLSLI